MDKGERKIAQVRKMANQITKGNIWTQKKIVGNSHKNGAIASAQTT